MRGAGGGERREGSLRAERSSDWNKAAVGDRGGGVPVRARVQVARLLDILTKESAVLETKLEEQVLGLLALLVQRYTH